MTVLMMMSLMLLGAPDTQRMALVIANNHSLDKDVRPLRFADDDGARFYELLTGLGYDTRFLAVLDEETGQQHPEAASAARQPTWSRLERVLLELRAAVAEAHRQSSEVELIITYSGHGAVGRTGVPYINLLDRRLYRGDFFRDVVAAVGADFVHLIIDACRARDFVDARGGPDGPDFDRELSLFLAQERRMQHPEVGVVVAESADGETHEWSRTRSGIFGHEVISGLAGGADVNGDGVVEYSELHAFVASANHAIRDPRARLRVTAQPPTLNPRRALVRLTEATGLERIRTPMSGGRYTLEDDRGVRWVDVHLDDGQQATLYLPRRERYYIIDVANKREAAIELHTDNAVVLIAALPFDTHNGAVSRGSIAEALNSDLFRTPYGFSFYRGFVVAMRYPSVEEEEEERAVRLVAPPVEPAEPTEPESSPVEQPVAPKPTQEEEAVRAAEEKVAALTPPTAGEQVDDWSRWRVVRWVTGLGGVAFATAGLALGISALTDAADAKRRPFSDQQRARLDDAHVRANVADVFVGVGIAGGVVWGLSWFMEE